MRQISKIDLIDEAKKKGYRPEILEKVIMLLNLLEQYFTVSYLQERLVLKGGSALNLFCFDNIPRLSVDLDFNYIGSLDKQTMFKERIKIENLLISIAEKNKLKLHRQPNSHAGGKIVFIYQSLLDHKGKLEVDINYVFRIPVFPHVYKNIS